MNTLIEISALLAGLTVFVLLAVISLAMPPERSSKRGRDRFVPGNYHPDAHHGLGHGGDHWG